MTSTPRNLNGFEAFWYILGCLAFLSSYLMKVPAKKALREVHGSPVTGPEMFWYYTLCILGLGTGYFAKVAIKKALIEVAER